MGLAGPPRRRRYFSNLLTGDLVDGQRADEILQLTEDARLSRRHGWWTAPEYRRHLTSGLMQLLGFEAEATEIRAYQPVLVPGVLQTPAVADFILGFWDTTLNDDDRRVRHDVRTLRRQQVIEREAAPAYHLVLDESVLGRNVGGTKLAADQLEALAEAAHLPNVHIRVVPLDRGGILGLLGPFIIVDLGAGDPEDAVLYRESWSNDVLIHDAKEVRDHHAYFEVLWRQSWSEDVTLRLIEARATMLRSSLDRIDN